MKPHSYRIRPAVSPDVCIEINDDRTSLGPDEDLVEIAIAFSDVNSRIGIALSVDEIARLRDVLDEVARRTD